MSVLSFWLFQQQHYVHLCAGVKGLIEVNTLLETHGIYCLGPMSRGQRWGSNSVDWSGRWKKSGRFEGELTQVSVGVGWLAVHIFRLGGVLYSYSWSTLTVAIQIWTRSFTASPPQRVSMQPDHLKVDKQEVQHHWFCSGKKRLVFPVFCHINRPFLLHS